jgi:hypothetical protein
MNDGTDDTVIGPHQADPHAEYHRQAAAHFGRPTHPQPGDTQRMARDTARTQAAENDPQRPGGGWHGRAQSQNQPPAPGGYRDGAATFSGDSVAQWLAAPGNLKLVAAAVGGLIALIVFLTGGSAGKIAALILVIGGWAIFFRHGYHEKAGLQAQTRIPADEATRTAVGVANRLRGPLSSIQFNGSNPGRADFGVRGKTWKPLEFHVALRADPSGWTFVSTHLDSWTWRRERINFIPVPLTKRIDGYGLYKSFGDQLLKELQQRDQSTTGAFNKRPQ